MCKNPSLAHDSCNIFFPVSSSYFSHEYFTSFFSLVTVRARSDMIVSRKNYFSKLNGIYTFSVQLCSLVLKFLQIEILLLMFYKSRKLVLRLFSKNDYTLDLKAHPFRITFSMSPRSFKKWKDENGIFNVISLI